MGVVTVVGTDTALVTTVGELLAGRDTIEVNSVPDIAALRGGTLPHVIVVGPSLGTKAGIDMARNLDDHDHAAVVIVANEIDAQLLREALRSGVRDVLALSDSATEITRALTDAHDDAVQARGSVERPVAAPVKRGHVVAVFSTKGGVGKSVLATNLGASIAANCDASVCLVDLDLEFGDVGIMLGIEPKLTIADAVQRIDQLDPELLAGYLSDHSSGLKVLLAPVRPEDAETVTTSRITKILEVLSTMFDVLVLDTAATLDEVVLTALDKSDEVFAVTMMDVASIKNTRISLQKLQQLGLDDGALRLVLNRADSKVWLQPDEVEKAVGAKIFAKIPSDRVVPRSVNRGRPVVLDEPKSDVSKALASIARGIAASAKEVASDVA